MSARDDAVTLQDTLDAAVLRNVGVRTGPVCSATMGLAIYYPTCRRGWRIITSCTPAASLTTLICKGKIERRHRMFASGTDSIPTLFAKGITTICF